MVYGASYEGKVHYIFLGKILIHKWGLLSCPFWGLFWRLNYFFFLKLWVFPRSHWTLTSAQSDRPLPGAPGVEKLGAAVQVLALHHQVDVLVAEGARHVVGVEAVDDGVARGEGRQRELPSTTTYSGLNHAQGGQGRRPRSCCRGCCCCCCGCCCCCCCSSSE